jgi:hypothetical protein
MAVHGQEKVTMYKMTSTQDTSTRDTSTRDTSTRDTSTPGDLWESQIPMTCSFLPTSIPQGIPLRSH